MASRPAAPAAGGVSHWRIRRWTAGRAAAGTRWMLLVLLVSAVLSCGGQTPASAESAASASLAAHAEPSPSPTSDQVQPTPAVIESTHPPVVFEPPSSVAPEAAAATASAAAGSSLDSTTPAPTTLNDDHANPLADAVEASTVTGSAEAAPIHTNVAAPPLAPSGDPQPGSCQEKLDESCTSVPPSVVDPAPMPAATIDQPVESPSPDVPTQHPETVESARPYAFKAIHTHAPWTAARKLEARETVREMVRHAYGSYMRHSFPHDELKPISQTWTNTLGELGNARATAPPRTPFNAGRGHVYDGLALTLVDSLSTLAILGHRAEFAAAVEWIVHHLHFEYDLRVHLFEANIRLLGGLLSAHCLLTDASTAHLFLDPPIEFVSIRPTCAGETRTFTYEGGLLRKAVDLADRLLVAFPSAHAPVQPTPDLQPHADAKARAACTGLPAPFVHLVIGVMEGETTDTCTAGAGTFLMEFGVLSALTGDLKYYHAADRATTAVFSLRSPQTGLLPNSFDRRGNIRDDVSSLGSGIDSFLEYLLKGSILLDTKKHLDMYELVYEAAQRHLKVAVAYERNPAAAATATASTTTTTTPAAAMTPDDLLVEQLHNAGLPPTSFSASSSASGGASYQQQSARRTQKDWLLEATSKEGQRVHYSFNSLSVFFPSLQVLSGHLESARGFLASAFELWHTYSGLPERYLFTVGQLHPTERHYPLRPELAESVYYMYRATRDPLYLSVAARMVDDLNKYARVPGGFAGIKDVGQKRASAGVGASAQAGEGEGGEEDKRELVDRQESFFLAETLPYLYLTFDEAHWLHVDQPTPKKATPPPPTADASNAGASVGPDGSSSSPAQAVPLTPPAAPRATSWLFTTEGHLLPIRGDIQAMFSDDEQVYQVLPTSMRSVDDEPPKGHARDLHFDASFHPPAPGSLREELEVWEVKRRMDERARLVGDEALRAEIHAAVAAGKATAIVKELAAAAHQLISHPSALSSSVRPATTEIPHPTHRWAHLMRYREGFSHPAIVAAGADPAKFPLEHEYYLQRVLGLQTAFGGQPDAALRNQRPMGEPYTGVLQFSAHLPPVSVREALYAPRARGGSFAHGGPRHAISMLNAVTCAYPTSLRPTTAPAHFHAYSARWRQWARKRTEDMHRLKAYEEWVADKAARDAKAAATAAAAPAPAAPPSSAASPVPAVHPGPPHAPNHPPVQQFVMINGQRVPLPPNIAELLQQQAQAQAASDTAAAAAAAGEPNPNDHSAAAARHRHHSTGGGAPSKSFSDGAGGEDGHAETVGDFSVESEFGSFHIIHHPSASSLTIRNLGTELVELVDETELQPMVEVREDERGPLLRSTMVMMDDENFLATYQLEVHVPEICDGIVPAAAGQFGRPPPKVGVPEADRFLADDLHLDSPFDALAALARMAPAGKGQDGVLKGFVVRAHPALACKDILPADAEQMRGRIVLVERGSCTFVEKALHLQKAGAVGMIVWNRSQPNYAFLMGTDHTGRDITLPSAMVDEHGGAWLSRCISKFERAQAAELRGTKPKRFSQVGFPLALRKLAHASGSSVAIHPFPTFTPLDAITLPADQQHLLAQTPKHVVVTGGANSFTVRTQNGWTAEVVLDPKTRNYQLRLTP